MVKRAILTIDVDCMHGHVMTVSGCREMREKEDFYIDLSYQRWLPRFLDILDHHELKATFFLVADFARMHANASVVRSIVAKGHEVASHTLTHRIDLCSADFETKTKEIVESKKVLEDLTGTPVLGFRGPGYATDRHIVELLMENGYLYDSSVVPGYLFATYKRFVWVFDRLFSKKPLLFPNRPTMTCRHPFVILEDSHRRLLEIPINVLPIIPVPFVSFIMLSRGRFRGMYSLVRRRTNTLMYQFHDFEFMDCDVPEEYVRTTATVKCGRRSLSDRLSLYDWAISRITGDYSIVTAGEFAHSFLGERSAPTRPMNPKVG